MVMQMAMMTKGEQTMNPNTQTMMPSDATTPGSNLPQIGN